MPLRTGKTKTGESHIRGQPEQYSETLSQKMGEEERKGERKRCFLSSRHVLNAMLVDSSGMYS